MATAYKILGQSAPSDTNNSNLYIVPNLTSTVISTLLITNTDTSEATCRIYARKNGEAASKSNAIIYDGSILPNDLKAITVGITLNSGDVITVQSSVPDSLTFQAFGSEVS